MLTVRFDQMQALSFPPETSVNQHPVPQARQQSPDALLVCTIRADQLKALSLPLETQANQRLTRYARQRFPVEFQPISESALLTFAESIRARAMQFGIEHERDVATFFDLAVMYGQEFDEAAWAADILTCDALHGPDKMVLLRHRVQTSGLGLQSVMSLAPKAATLAYEKLWKCYPELKRRHLTMDSQHELYRRNWMGYYREAVAQTPAPPPPRVEPQPVAAAPPPIVVSNPYVSCNAIAVMTHEEKMVAAILAANLGAEIMAELGDMKTLVTTMSIACGGLVAIAATGCGGIAEAIGVGLMITGAATPGIQIGEGINSMIDFYQQTRSDRARTPEDLTEAGRSFAGGIATMGVGGLDLLLSLAGVSHEQKA